MRTARRGVIIAAALGLLAPGLVALQGGANPTVELLQGSLGGRQANGAIRLFRGAELYGHIDGGAEIFLELGFAELAVARLGHGKAEVGAELYRMADATAALGIYLARSGGETPDRRLAARHTVGRHQLQLVEGPFYLCLDTPEDTKVTAADLADVASAIVARLPRQAQPDVLGILPREGRIGGSERVVRGPVGLSSLITLGEGDILSFGGTVTAWMADYAATADVPAHTVLIADYPDAAAAGRAVAHLKAHLDPEVRLTPSSEERLSFVDYSGRAGLVEVQGERLTLRLLTAGAKP